MLTQIGGVVVKTVLDAANILVKDTGNTGSVVIVLLTSLVFLGVWFFIRFSRRQKAVAWLNKKITGRSSREEFSRDIDLISNVIREGGISAEIAR